MKRTIFTYCLILVTCNLYSQIEYLDTVQKGWYRDGGVYESGGKAGFIVRKCNSVIITVLKDGKETEFFMNLCSEEDTVISHLLGYTYINGYHYATPVYDSKTTTVKNKHGKWAVLDSTFTLASDFIYDLALPIVNEPVAAVKKGKLWGFVGNGGLYVKPQYTFPYCDNGEEPYEHIPFDGGVLWMGEEYFKKNGRVIKYYVMLKKGQVVYIDKESLREVEK